MNIETYGAGLRLRAAAELAGKFLPNVHLIMLPVPTTRDNKHVNGTDILLEDTLVNASRGSVAVGYNLPDWYALRLAKLGCAVHELSGDEEYMKENAYITAVGTVGYILTTEKRCPADIRFGIVGYGRIGRALTEMLLFFGARVRIFTSQRLTRIDLGELGIASSCSADICSGDYCFDDIDVLINTAPKDMSGCFEGGTVREGMRLLELASGENFKGVSGVERLPALPEKMFPESAGRAYFKSLKRFLEGEK